MLKPTGNVDWAEGAGAQTSEPTNERARGFPFRYVLPAEQINWMFRTIGRWILWLAFQHRTFEHLDDFVEQSQPGEVALVGKYDVNTRPGGFLSSAAFGGAAVYSDGRYVLVGGVGEVTICQRRNLTSTVGSLAAGGAGMRVDKLRGDGVRVLVSSINHTPGSITGVVECFDYTNPGTENLVWEVVTTPVSGPVGIALAGRWAFIAKGGSQIAIYEAQTGSQRATFTADVDILEIAAFGDSVYIARLDNVIQKLEYEAGALVSRWEITTTSYGGENALVCDEFHAYLIHGATGQKTNWLTVIAAGGAIERNAYVWTPIDATGGARVCIDENYLYIARADGFVDVLDKRSAGVIRRVDVGGDYTSAVSSDGDAFAVSVFYSFDSSYVTTNFKTPKRMPRKYLRTNAENYLPYQKLAIELEN